MSADFNSTAQALALSISPPQSPVSHQAIRHAAWHRPTSSLSRRLSHSSGPLGVRDKMIDSITKARRRLVKLVGKMTLVQKTGVGLFGIIGLTMVILLFLYGERIFGWLEPYAEMWREWPGGWILLWLAIFISAFPPMIGYSMGVTICGFVYGVALGWPLAATANVAGSVCALILSRTLFADFVHRLVAHDTRFTAFSLVLKHDGLKVLVMIRLCPLPYSLSNGALSTVKTISPLSYGLATAMASPKLLIHIFVGNRLAAIARSGGEMDATTKVVNYLSIASGLIIGAVTGYFIYRRTVARASELEAEERARLGHRTNGLPHPDDFEDDVERDDVLVDNDEIDFLDAGRDDRYQDEADHLTDFEGDEEEAIGMDVRAAE